MSTLTDERLRGMQQELAGETGEKVFGKQTIYWLITELLERRSASEDIASRAPRASTFDVDKQR